MAFNMEDWYNEIKNSNALLSYRGEISAELITKVLDKVENALEQTNEDSKIKKKIYNVLVETLQNLFHHIEPAPEGEEHKFGENFAIFALYKEGHSYKISTGNFVKPEKMQMLKDRIDQINYLEKDQLKELYKMILNNEEFSEKGGGGLGMIDIVRKTGNKLIYKFHHYSKDKNFFCLDVTIN